ncbi:MAG: hypothetical protein EXS12_01915 [Phycisphaerales bacterium]|nr:hypothetical protein [Phycisphaerales bacterium]
MNQTQKVVVRVVPLHVDLENQIRRCCFGSTAKSMREFGVTPNEIILHLENAGLAVASRPERVLENLDSIVHAVACIRGDSRGWIELVNQHGWCLERAAMETFSVDGALSAHRFWSELRLGTNGERGGCRNDGWPLPRLQWFAGLRPLRHWLADRLFGGLEAISESKMRARLDTRSNPHTLADVM